MQSDPNLEDFNVQSRVDDFVAAVNSYYTDNAKSGNIMFQVTCVSPFCPCPRVPRAHTTNARVLTVLSLPCMCCSCPLCWRQMGSDFQCTYRTLTIRSFGLPLCGSGDAVGTNGWQ